MLTTDDKRQFSPAAERNQRHIFERLVPWINHFTQNLTDDELSLLEIASGTGQHAAYFSSQVPLLRVHPSDRTLNAVASVASWASALNVEGRVAPLRLLDVTINDQWPSERHPIIYCANMIHISPWSTTEALFVGAASRLHPHGVLVTYGPYRFDESLAPSNIAFDESLRARDPRWGIREIGALDVLAARVGLKRVETHSCPANNHLLIFRHTSTLTKD